ncbi:uncharacterized protein HMPREF1541_10657 [Cyphellophora europaea CBS 101466]|uniref:UBC core domain-containing protein n=1 Tax=Cyphellophora europaea (strain CBS 101466) TaxID=1220924 RepID=W2S5Y6_CYPE1|nr:uncharacterized protein HMPREF1541_10657 [Cyphellophora europaea CBS 101466]ETN44107.1 hypothetical protein HMPREF1541_10657 [Cyphellophora europaea CBS 101466]
MQKLTRQGPFESAILRFEITFPSAYPDVAPVVTFSTDVFHPLVVPLTQYTFSTSAPESTGTVSASDEYRVPPGSFSLRHGFPQWFRHGTIARSSLENKFELEPTGALSAESAASGQETLTDTLDSRKITLQLLHHIKQSFEDAEFLDNLPFAVVGNPSAWHSWRAYRGLARSQTRGRSLGDDEPAEKPPSSPKQMSDWNWDGVWESRVRNGIDSSISEAGLFTNQGLVRFAKLDKEQLDAIRQQIRAS